MSVHQAYDRLTWVGNNGTPWPRLAWVGNPNNNPHPGLAHATYDGSKDALCGVRTTYLGDPWPKFGECWSSACSRCPSCALRLYSGRV